jgi:hypothetical protein
MERILETIDKRIQNLEEDLKHAKLMREKAIEEANNNELYRNKYYYRIDNSQNGRYKFYYHVIYAEQIINENQLQFQGDSIIVRDGNRDIEYSYSTGTLVFTITDILEITKEEYMKILNNSLDYVTRKFHNIEED